MLWAFGSHRAAYAACFLWQRVEEEGLLTGGGGGGKLEVPTDVAHACAHQLVYVRASSSSHSFIDC